MTDLERDYLVSILRVAQRLADGASLEADVAHLRNAHRVLTSACEATDRAETALKTIFAHWDEFGPEHGFDETLNRARDAWRFGPSKASNEKGIIE